MPCQKIPENFLDSDFYILTVPDNWDCFTVNTNCYNDDGSFVSDYFDWLHKYQAWILENKRDPGVGLSEFLSSIGLPPRDLDYLFESGYYSWNQPNYQIFYIQNDQYMPVSPVFASIDLLEKWVDSNGHPKVPKIQ